jgi:acylphosphatase
MQCLGVIVSGRVQGVGYRAWMARQARGLGLRGWVRNRSNGNVEAVLAGPSDSVDAMIASCRKGPQAAIVTGIQTFPAENENWPNFSVRPTH